MKVKSESEVAQSCQTLRNPMDCSLPGSSVHGIFQASVLEWLPFPSPGSPVLQADSLPTELSEAESESEVAQSYPTLCNPMDCSLPRFSVHGIFQPRVLEWVAISFLGDLPSPGIEPWVACIVGRCFTV